MNQPEKHRRIRRLYITDYALTPRQRIEHAAILCENNRIIAVGAVSAFSIAPELEVYELPNAYAMPGFIDTHIHGAGGFDASRAGKDQCGIGVMSQILAARGVTGYVPTVVSTPRNDMLNNLATLSEMLHNPPSGAVPVGIHIEGPFINPRKRGAQREQSISPVDLGFARELIAAGGGWIRRMTFAPELENADKLVELLCESHVLPSMGHSVADEKQTLRAIDAGAHCCTHLFNGMPPLEQRQISITSVALTDNRVTTELIIDGRHLHPRMVELACRCKPSSKLVAISDGTMASGMPNGVYWIGDAQILVNNGYSQTAEGLLAGTTTLLDTGWHSLMNYANTDENYAAGSVSLNAAESLGLSDRGTLRPGTRADIAIFECKTNRLLLTICGGEIVFRAQNVEPAKRPELTAEDAE